MVDASDVLQNLFAFQKKTVKALENNEKLTIETSVYEIMALMNIILLKPEQNNKAMIDAFGGAVLNNLHSTTIEK
ncbi:hypothetical protein BDC45DRAFT_496370 [Circinella umbellata]|nr:hypothetical protein BDC45DRAFT_496370 [Circinella umbellata]